MFQMLINILIFQEFFDWRYFVILVIASGIAVISIRLVAEGKEHLLKPRANVS
jgi:hypothetical protein